MRSQPVTVAILGAGSRGSGFGTIISRIPQWAKVVAVAEPRREYREAFASAHGLHAEMVFRDWQELVSKPRICDAVVISTMDRDHVAPALACTKLGYHMLLEKPMATSIDDCSAIAAAQTAARTITCVCHSLRYNKSLAELHHIASSGRIGRIVSIDQLEQVAWWHQAHSFVRGNWGNEGRSTFMLLAKSCHDLDYIAHLVGVSCLGVQSFGGISLFDASHAPSGSGERCVDCRIEQACPYSAIRTYIDADRTRWPAAAISFDHSREAHWKAIETGPYGRCVWKTDNDVVDHQVVAFEFAGGVTGTFTMTAFTQGGGRKIRVHGTEGEIEFMEGTIEIRTFANNNREVVTIGAETGGHGGGDSRVMTSFLRAIREDDPRLVVTDVHESLATHRIVFAAEISRREGRVVALSELGG